MRFPQGYTTINSNEPILSETMENLLGLVKSHGTICIAGASRAFPRKVECSLKTIGHLGLLSSREIIQESAGALHDIFGQ